MSAGGSHLESQHQLVELSSISSETCSSNGIALIGRINYDNDNDNNNFRALKRHSQQSNAIFVMKSSRIDPKVNNTQLADYYYYYYHHYYHYYYYHYYYYYSYYYDYVHYYY